jgi:hypothetical protein
VAAPGARRRCRGRARSRRPHSCYVSKMGFSDEARKLALQEQAEQQARDAQDPNKPFIENTRRALNMAEQDEQWRSYCKEEVGKWFDRVGMLPRPPHSIGEFTYRPRRYPDRFELCIEITWEFDGYKYRAACTGDLKSLPTVEICIKGYWLPAGNTKIAVGRALLQDPGGAWERSIMKSARVPAPERYSSATSGLVASA